MDYYCLLMSHLKISHFSRYGSLINRSNNWQVQTCSILCLNTPFCILTGFPLGTPLKFTGCATPSLFTGKEISQRPLSPLCSHTRNNLPPPSGQKYVETKKRTHRLCQIGGAVESVLGSAIEEEDIPKLIGFLKRQEANGKFFSKAMQKEPVANTEEV